MEQNDITTYTNAFLKIANSYDKKRQFKKADKITNSFIKTASPIFFIAFIQAIEFNTLVSNLYQFYNAKDLTQYFEKHNLKVNESHILHYNTMTSSWYEFFEDIELNLNPIKNLNEPIKIQPDQDKEIYNTLKAINKNKVPIIGQLFTYPELKEEIISRAENMSKMQTDIFETGQELNKDKNKLENIIGEIARKDIEKSNDPIPEE
jgi:hypothetical protein